MAEKNLSEKVLSGLEKAGKKRIVVLPDFFLDHFIKIDDPSKFFSEMELIGQK